MLPAEPRRVLSGCLFLISVAFPSASALKSRVIWSSGFEKGDISEWYAPSGRARGDYGGGMYNSGKADARPSREVAHTGRWGLKMTISTPPESGARLFRWREPRRHRTLYYSAWLYVPDRMAVRGNYLNLMQFKSRSEDNRRNDPLWVFHVTRTRDGPLYISAAWGAGQTETPGPYAESRGGFRNYTQRAASLPVGRWVHLEALLEQSSGFDGRVAFWQDGIKLFDFRNVRTSYKNCKWNSWCAANDWSVNLYSDGLAPNPAVVYLDDAMIRLPER